MTKKGTAAQQLAELKRRTVEIGHLYSVGALLEWDQDVYMPPKGSESRAQSIAVLSGIAHAHLVALDADGLLSDLKRKVDDKKIKGVQAAIVTETWRTYTRACTLPEHFVRELAESTSRAHDVWAQARAKNDFALFLPWLKKVIALKQKEAEYVGYHDSPYDALLDEYEPGMTTREVARVLNDLKDFLTPFIVRITASHVAIDRKKILGTFPVEQQRIFNTWMLKKLGFDLDAGRLDASVHPFSTGFHPQDVRLTTRYNENDMLDTLGSTIHETGHALYEQGFNPKHFGTPLAEAVSLGIHESQSRMWENMIGKSKSFWKYFYPALQKAFPKPFKKLSRDEFYTALNTVTPSLIRVEADEVTYNLHIILRFELERELIEGTINPKDLPRIWNARMKELFGVTVPHDAQGVLQDVHWSAGLFGYFPTYSLGNLYAAQLYAAMQRDIPDLEKQFARGNFTDALQWLRTHIHRYGKTYTAAQLVKKATGEPLNSRYFCEYLEKKYRAIYKLT